MNKEKTTRAGKCLVFSHLFGSSMRLHFSMSCFNHWFDFDLYEIFCNSFKLNFKYNSTSFKILTYFSFVSFV